MFADARYSSTTPPKLLFRPHDEAPRNTPDDLMIVFLPALADAAERVCAEVRSAAGEDGLGCHHPGGTDGVDDRFWMRITGPN